jgi:hypothetical protein
MLVLCHEFAECGPNSISQMNTSFNYTRGTLRGMGRGAEPRR